MLWFQNADISSFSSSTKFKYSHFYKPAKCLPTTVRSLSWAKRLFVIQRFYSALYIQQCDLKQGQWRRALIGSMITLTSIAPDKGVIF